jgi:hypothetical protein
VPRKEPEQYFNPIQFLPDIIQPFVFLPFLALLLYGFAVLFPDIFNVRWTIIGRDGKFQEAR